MGARHGGETDQQNVIMHKAYSSFFLVTNEITIPSSQTDLSNFKPSSEVDRPYVIWRCESRPIIRLVQSVFAVRCSFFDDAYFKASYLSNNQFKN